MTTEVIKIDFFGKPLTVIKHNGIDYIAVGPIIDRLGLGQHYMLKTINYDSSLKSAILSFNQATNDGGSESIKCLPLKKINTWLFKFNPSTYDAERGEKIKCFRDNCFSTVCAQLYPGILEGQKKTSKNFTKNVIEHVAWTVAELKKEHLARKQLEAENAQLIKIRDDLVIKMKSITEQAVKVCTDYFQQ